MYGDIKKPLYINTDIVIYKNNLYGYLSNSLVINVDDPQPVNIEGKEGVYGQPILNTKRILSISRNTIPNFEFDNGITGIDEDYKDVINHSNVLENAISSSNGFFKNKQFSMRARLNKYFQSGDFDIRLADIIIPTDEVKNGNDRLWSPYNVDEN